MGDKGIFTPYKSGVTDRKHLSTHPLRCFQNPKSARAIGCTPAGAVVATIRKGDQMNRTAPAPHQCHRRHHPQWRSPHRPTAPPHNTAIPAPPQHRPYAATATATIPAPTAPRHHTRTRPRHRVTRAINSPSAPDITATIPTPPPSNVSPVPSIYVFNTGIQSSVLDTSFNQVRGVLTL